MGEIMIDFLIKGTLACIIGILITDLDLYKRKKISFLALIAGTFTCIAGIYVSLYIMDLLNGLAAMILCLLIIEVPTILVYNFISDRLIDS
jgi:hypothetical protein